MNITALGVRPYGLVNFINNSEKPAFRVFLPDYKLRHMQEGCNPVMHTANPRITRLIRSEKSSRNTKTRKVNN
jgi:hypothetical protein